MVVDLIPYLDTFRLEIKEEGEGFSLSLLETIHE